MAKSKSSTSKVKLTNKSTNKRMKSKRKHKLNRGMVQTQVSITSSNKVLKTDKNKGKHVKHVSNLSQNQMDEEISEDELAFSDEEMLEYVNENAQNMSLLSIDLSEMSNSQRKKSKEKSAEFENAPRYFSKMSEHQNSNDNKVELLPLKGDRGLIQQSREIQVLPANDVDIVEEECQAHAADEQAPNTKALSMVEILANHRADITSNKLKIAHLSQDIIEDPDKVGSLKELINLCGRAQAVAVRKLSLLSLVEVFKDIIPSYRIRELTDQEHAIKVSRDVCALREFENTLLSSYQTYLTILEDNITDCLKLLKRQRSNGKSEVSLKPMVSLATISAQCLCELLKAVPHFNFRSNIIAVVVPKIELSGELSQIGMVCYNGVKSALIADKAGHVSLEIVKVVNKLVKSKIHVKPKILEVLLYLQLNIDAIRSAEEKGNKMERLRKKREAIMKMSKKEKKKKKFEDQLNKEMQEAEAVENRDKVERSQTEILKFLFVIYFRVLKADHVSSILPAVLQGLAKFSHFINVDFFHDLMVAIEKILKMEGVGMNESLNCIRTAAKILSGQGEILTIDPKQFYTELYSRLLFVSADGVDTEIGMAKLCVEDMILKRKKQVSIVQVMGFFKRLATMLLQLKSEDVIEYAMLVRNILQVHRKCDNLLDNDTCSRGTFQPEVPDPEYSNAESSTLWELALLSTHYHPHVNIISKHLIDGAPSQGDGSLPSNILTRNSANTKRAEELQYYFPEFVHPRPTSKCFYNSNVGMWRNKTFESAVQGHVQSRVGCDVNVDKLFPTAKRKKCNST